MLHLCVWSLDLWREVCIWWQTLLICCMNQDILTIKKTTSPTKREENKMLTMWGSCSCVKMWGLFVCSMCPGAMLSLSAHSDHINNWTTSFFENSQSFNNSAWGVRLDYTSYGITASSFSSSVSIKVFLFKVCPAIFMLSLTICETWLFVWVSF